MYLKVSLCGVGFSLIKSKLTKFPETLLGQLATIEPKDNGPSLGLCEAYIPETDEYYFRSPPEHFTWILTFYQSGVLHKPDSVCSIAYNSEVFFWGLLPHYTEHCCLDCFRHLKRPQTTTTTNTDRRISFVGPQLFREIDHPNTTFCQKYAHVKQYIWEITENPEHSKYALGFTFISIAFVMASLMIVILESLPQFYTKLCSDAIVDFSLASASNMTQSPEAKTFKSELAYNLTNFGIKNTVVRSAPTLRNQTESNESAINPEDCKGTYHTFTNGYLDTADTIVLIFFTVEFCLRLWSTGVNRCRFLIQPMSIIDLLAFLPFWVEKGLDFRYQINNLAKPNPFPTIPFQSQKLWQVIRVIRIMKVFRALRVLKLVRYSTDLQIIGKTLRRSLSELLLILACLFLCTIMFSTLLYYAEFGAKDTHYSTIPDAMWWSVSTLFMYSDAPPVTVLGKCVAALGFAAGVLLLAFPISILVDNFSEIYAKDHSAAMDAKVKGAAKKRQKRRRKRYFMWNPLARASVFF